MLRNAQTSVHEYHNSTMITTAHSILLVFTGRINMVYAISPGIVLSGCNLMKSLRPEEISVDCLIDVCVAYYVSPNNAAPPIYVVGSVHNLFYSTGDDAGQWQF